MVSMADQIRVKIEEALDPVRLEIVNDSARHRGHAGDNGSGESHFSLMIVSQKFEGLRKVERHRAVYGLLQDVLSDGRVHALSISALTPEEDL